MKKMLLALSFAAVAGQGLFAADSEHPAGVVAQPGETTTTAHQPVKKPSPFGIRVAIKYGIDVLPGKVCDLCQCVAALPLIVSGTEKVTTCYNACHACAKTHVAKYPYSRPVVKCVAGVCDLCTCFDAMVIARAQDAESASGACEEGMACCDVIGMLFSWSQYSQSQGFRCWDNRVETQLCVQGLCCACLLCDIWNDSNGVHACASCVRKVAEINGSVCTACAASLRDLLPPVTVSMDGDTGKKNQ